jgi:hypothetical protein
MNTTRRTFLGAAAVASLPVAALASPVRTPQQRIEAAIAEIEAAMRELHPGWDVQIKNDVIRPIKSDKREGDPSRHGVLIFATGNLYGPEKGRWFVDHV